MVVTAKPLSAGLMDDYAPGIYLYRLTWQENGRVRQAVGRVVR